MQPVNPLLEEGVAPGYRLVIPPIISIFKPLRERGEVRKHHLANRVLSQQPPQTNCQRLIVVILSNKHDTSSPVTRRSHPQIILHPQIGRLLHEHVLPS